MAQEQLAASTTFAPCVTGWNARDPLDSMIETDAISLVNWFPNGSNLQLRKGFTVHSTSLGTGSVRTLAEHVSAAGARKLVACANGKIYDSTTAGAAATQLATGFTVNNWQTTLYRNKLILVNGSDQPQQYDGTSVTAANYTGIADDAVLINVSAYKGRLYFVEKNSGNIWWGAVDAVTGALTQLDLSSLLRLGGNIVYAGSWTRDSGSGMQDLFVVLSNMGEVLLYEGDYPTSSTWNIAGRYLIGAPLGGYRAAINMGPDLIVMAQDGFYPLSDLLSADTGRTFSKLSDKIRDAVSDAAKSYSGNFGWSACYFPKEHMVLFNVPIASDTNYEQYVVNTITGAWTKFRGMNGSCFATFNGDLYFGGTDGKVYHGYSGYKDNTAPISTVAKCAFNYFGDRERKKRFMMARPIYFGDVGTKFLMDVDVDFTDKQITSTVSTTGHAGSPWDTSPWDTSSWDSALYYGRNWYSIRGIGRCGALKFIADFCDIEIQLTSVQVTYENGGAL